MGGRKRNGKNINCLECGLEFYIPKCYIDVKLYCSLKCSCKASKLKRLGDKNPAWKGNKGLYAYTNLHKHLRRIHGHALLCRNENCSGNSKVFGWANITGTYSTDISNFTELCKSCHTNFDRYKKPLKLNENIIKKQNICVQYH